MPLFVGIAKFGVAGGFVMLYVSTVDVFPAMFAATALGMVNFSARLFTSIDPQVSERPEPIPMAVYIGLCLSGMVIVQFVKPLRE